MTEEVRFRAPDHRRTEVVELEGTVVIPEWAADMVVLDDEKTMPLHRSRYPAHVPTIAEQALTAEWTVDDMNTRAKVADGSAKGVVVDPLTHRSHYEDYYESDSTRERMEDHTGEEDGGGLPKTEAATLGPDHERTVFPSALED